MTKRLRPHPHRPGVLQAYWGVCRGDRTPDVVYNWGEGIGKPDGHLLHSVFMTLLPELESRGYDLTTLKFTIKKSN